MYFSTSDFRSMFERPDLLKFEFCYFTFWENIEWPMLLSLYFTICNFQNSTRLNFVFCYTQISVLMMVDENGLMKKVNSNFNSAGLSKVTQFTACNNQGNQWIFGVESVIRVTSVLVSEKKLNKININPLTVWYWSLNHLIVKGDLLVGDYIEE